MLSYAGRRLIALAPQLVLISLVSFLLVDLAPGDAAATLAGDRATAADIERIRQLLGLDRPVLVRYFEFVKRVVTGDLGSSIFSSQRVTTIIGNRLWVTVSLVVVALSLSMTLGAGAGMLAALRRGRLTDRLITAGAGLGLAVPPFVASIFLLKVFALDRDWLPAGGFEPLGGGVWEWLSHLILPAVALAFFPGAELARLVRTSISATLPLDYVEAARAKGLPFRRVFFKHTMKNAAIPIVTVLGIQMGRLFGGAVIVETIFDLPGLGSLTVDAVANRDVPVIQGIVLVSAVIVIGINFFVDLSYGYFNPRLRR